MLSSEESLSLSLEALFELLLLRLVVVSVVGLSFVRLSLGHGISSTELLLALSVLSSFRSVFVSFMIVISWSSGALFPLSDFVGELGSYCVRTE